MAIVGPRFLLGKPIIVGVVFVPEMILAFLYLFPFSSQLVMFIVRYFGLSALNCCEFLLDEDLSLRYALFSFEQYQIFPFNFALLIGILSFPFFVFSQGPLKLFCFLHVLIFKLDNLCFQSLHFIEIFILLVFQFLLSFSQLLFQVSILCEQLLIKMFIKLSFHCRWGYIYCQFLDLVSIFQQHRLIFFLQLFIFKGESLAMQFNIVILLILLQEQISTILGRHGPRGLHWIFSGIFSAFSLAFHFQLEEVLFEIAHEISHAHFLLPDHRNYALLQKNQLVKLLADSPYFFYDILFKKPVGMRRFLSEPSIVIRQLTDSVPLFIAVLLWVGVIRIMIFFANCGRPFIIIHCVIYQHSLSADYRQELSEMVGVFPDILCYFIVLFHNGMCYSIHHQGYRGIWVEGASQVRSQTGQWTEGSATYPRERFLFLTLSLASSISFWVMSAQRSSAQIELGLNLVRSPLDQLRRGTSATVRPALYSGTSITRLYFWLACASSLSLSLWLSFILSRAQGGQMARISVPSWLHLTLSSSLAIRQVWQASTVLVQWRGQYSNLKPGLVERTVAPSGLTYLGFLNGSQWLEQWFYWVILVGQG